MGESQRISRIVRLKWLPAAVMVGVGALALSACGSSVSTSATKPSGGTIQVGVLGPLTGGGASYGTEWWQGVQLAVNQINKSGGITVSGAKYKIKATVCDDQFLPSKAVSCAQRLVSTVHPVALMMPSSVEAIPLMGFNQQDNFLLMATSQDHSFTSQGNKLVVRIVNDTSQTIGGTVKLAQEYFASIGLTAHRAAVMQVDTPLGASWAQGFDKAWKATPGDSVTATASYDANSTSFTNQVQSLMSTNPQVVVLTTVCQPSAIAVKEFRQAGFKGGFIQSAACSGGSGLTPYISASQIGPFVTEAFPYLFPNTSPSVAKFFTQFKAAYGHDPIQAATAPGFQAVKWLALSIEKAGTATNAAAIHKEFGVVLPQLNAEGANLMGVTSYNPNTGQISMAMGLGVTTSSGGLVQYKG